MNKRSENSWPAPPKARTSRDWGIGEWIITLVFLALVGSGAFWIFAAAIRLLTHC